MATATQSHRSTRSATQAAPPKRLSLADIVTKGSGLPNRYIIHGPEGVGKTSLPAYAPNPVYIQTLGETGLETLIDARQLPEIAHFPECRTWDDLLSILEELAASEHGYQTLVIDALNGAERMCHEEVCKRLFCNDWGKHGFTSYQQGPDAALVDWRKLLIALDRLRETKRMSIVCLCHSEVKTFKNPEGADYDRYRPAVHEKTWNLTNRWADAVLFINYETSVSESDPEKKGKATSSQTRLMYTERHAAYDAKHRLGLPAQINMGNSGQEAWNNFKAALVAGRNGKDGE